MNERRWTILGWLLLLIGFLPLFWFRAFWLDWFNHIWLTNHYAHVLATTGEFPSMLAVAADDAPTRPLIETGYPSLYGYLFYPLTSLPAALLGGDWVIRILSVLSVLACFECWRRLARRLAGNGLLAVLCALSVAAHPYVFTNLYNRSAVTEFFGYQWMTIALAAILRWLVQRQLGRPARGWTIFAACVLVALVGGTHPLTLYVFSLVVLPLLALLALALRWKPKLRQLAWFAAGIVVLAWLVGPWLLEVQRWSPEIGATQDKLSIGEFFDDWRHRFALLPFDTQLWQRDWLKNLRSTPMLEAPLNWLLAVLAAVLLWRGRKSPAGGAPTGWSRALLWMALVWILIFAVASVSPTLWTGSETVQRISSALLQPAQFGYRLLGPLQVSLVLLLLAVAAMVRSKPDSAAESRRDPGILDYPGKVAQIATVVVVAGILLKVGATFAFLPRLQRDWMQPSIDAYAQVVDGKGTLPHQFYGLSTYEVVGPSAPPRAGQRGARALFLKRNPRQPWRTFGVPLDLPADTELWIGALVTPFTRVIIDGREIPWSEMRTFDHCFMIRIPRPGAVLHVEVDPARHRRLNLQPWVWIAAAGVAGLSALFDLRKARSATSADTEQSQSA